MNIENKIKDLILYVVVNSKGQFFRAKGYNGSGESWVDDINKARLYAKLGPARSCVTFFSKDPKYTHPDIYKLSIGSFDLMIEERERAKKAVAKIKKAEEEWELKQAKWRLERAHKEVKDAEERLEQERKNLRK